MGTKTGITAPAETEKAPEGELSVEQLREEAKAEAEKLIAEAKAEAEKMIADAKAQVAEAEKQEAEKQVAPQGKANDPGEELVPYYIFGDNERYKGDVFVAVNGETLQIQRNKQVMIKRKFADVLDAQQAQDANTARYIARQSEDFESQRKALNI